MWALSYIGSNFALILVVVIAVIALGAVAWFARNWKVAVAALLVLGAGLAYQHVDKTAYQRRVSEEAAAEVATLKGRLATLQKQTAADAERAKADAAYIDALEALANDTPRNDTPAIYKDTANRIGAIK
jgi:CBS-domain-containing membrane protein